MDRVQLADDYGLVVDADGNVEALQRVGDGPLTVVNLFALRDVAEYADGEACSGVDAMLRYGASSGACVEGVGGQFVARGLPTGVIWGAPPDEHWDVVVVATYPHVDAFWSLLADPTYRDAFVHRRAAVAHQRVMVASAL